MDTFYQYEILTDNGRSLVISGDDNLDYAKVKALKDADYYLHTCNYYSVKIVYTETCKTCYNQGNVKQYGKRNKLTYKMVTCPNCKGHYPTFTDSFIVTKEGIKAL